MVKKNTLPSVPTENPTALRSLAEAIPVARTRAAPASDSFLNIFVSPLSSGLILGAVAVGQRTARAAANRCRGRRAWEFRSAALAVIMAGSELRRTPPDPPL